ncbi:MAG: hypothetical protein OHK93_008463 [Ramalina farinacea]|uniref:Importin N-terminal domain-containing protein n=1 Tax=Ramalina farinacea TaxID=258253 RepID=A0AA43QRS2_9LECA|nr:hypothetical protein [Ramalina farinacea]
MTATPKHHVAPFGFRDCDLEELAETRLNGREIKNMLNTAWRRASMIKSQVNNNRESLGKDVAGCVASYEWLIPGGWGWHSAPLPTSSLPGSSPNPSTVDVVQEQQEVYKERASTLFQSPINTLGQSDMCVGSRVPWTEVYPAHTRRGVPGQCSQPETERSLAAEVRKTRFGREWEEDEVMVRSDGRRRRSSVGKGNFERLGLAPRNSSAPDPGASVVLRYALSASPLNAQFRFQCWFCGRGGRRHADVLSRWRHDDSSTVFEVNVGTNGFKAIAHEGVLRKSPILTGEMVKITDSFHPGNVGGQRGNGESRYHSGQTSKGQPANRQAAGIALKNSFIAREYNRLKEIQSRWLTSVEPATKATVRQLVLQTLGSKYNHLPQDDDDDFAQIKDFLCKDKICSSQAIHRAFQPVQSQEASLVRSAPAPSPSSSELGQDARKGIWKAFLTAITATPKLHVTPFGLRDCIVEEPKQASPPLNLPTRPRTIPRRRNDGMPNKLAHDIKPMSNDAKKRKADGTPVTSYTNPTASPAQANSGVISAAADIDPTLASQARKQPSKVSDGPTGPAKVPRKVKANKELEVVIGGISHIIGRNRSLVYDFIEISSWNGVLVRPILII